MSDFNVEETAVNKVLKKEAAFYINSLLSIEGVEYRPQFGLSVSNKEPEEVQELFKYIVESNDLDALIVAVKSVTIGGDYIAEDVQDAELDKLLGVGAENTVLMVNSQKQYDPALFWINYEITSPFLFDDHGDPAVIRTSSTSITAKQGTKLFKSKLLALATKGGDVEVEVTGVRDATVKPKLKFVRPVIAA